MSGLADPESEPVPKTKALKDKWTRIFFDTLTDIFSAAKQSGIVLTPDRALAELDDVLLRAGLHDRPVSNEVSQRPLRIDVIAFKTKIHHRAVDLYYQTYFPRKAGMEGKPRRGASRLSLDYLDQILTFSRKGLNPAQIAGKMGQSDPKAKDRVAKQVRIAEKRYAEMVANIQALSRRQQSRNPKQS